MALATEPKPLAAPLPGGRDGASVRLHPLLAGEMLAPPCYLDRRAGRIGLARDVTGALASRGRGSWIWLPIPAFLIEHPSAGPVLVDTGFHASVASGVRANMGPLSPLLYRVRMTREQALAAQLAQRGVAITDVTTVVMTHLHIDHASGIAELPGATFVVDRREWEAAGERGGMTRGYVARQFDHAFDWRAIDYDAPELDSFASFGQSVDLFGDGSVRLLSTPGHTRGHQSVLLRLREREALLIGDAAFTRAALAGTAMPMILDDAHRYRRALGEIRRYLEQTPGALAIPGHDAEAWVELEPVYD
jgi:glyoxylase-like metal-dependent hydrolase (beta-lactamase superfamily II)